VPARRPPAPWTTRARFATATSVAIPSSATMTLRNCANRIFRAESARSGVNECQATRSIVSPGTCLTLTCRRRRARPESRDSPANVAAMGQRR
jgi:hypothetical protein